MINVTKPFLAPIDEVQALLADIWRAGILTNSGPLHQKFETELKNYLNSEYLSLYSNGTLALKAAIKILGLSGDIITTPFSFVATANVILDCGLKPVFVDIDPVTLNIDPAAIRASITPNTTGILPVHVYGTPCDVAGISRVAEEFDLKVIYDAAHAFGVLIDGESILNFGDASALSFHATKVFHSVEGGALAINSLALKKAADQYKNFGFTSEITVESVGINSKLNEIQSAIGLVNLRYFAEIISKRQKVFELYNSGLRDITGIEITHAALTSQNFSYFPIRVKDSFPFSRDLLYEKLKVSGINARRYFYPLIPDFEIYRDRGYDLANLPVARQVASEILCLPVYSDLANVDVLRIVDVIREASKGCCL